MSVFNLKLGQPKNVDVSSELLDASDFTPERLLTLEYAHDIAAQAFDPLTGLLAIGTLLCMLIRRPLPARTPYLHQELAQALYG